MSITHALSNAVTGLGAASRRAEIASHNIANASTPGYARQTVNAVHQVSGGRGNGVMLSPTERASDTRLTASRREAGAEAGGAQVEAGAARFLADTYGGLPGRITALETSLRSVTEAPESTALHDRAVAAASGIVSTFGAVTTGIEQARTEADGDISSAVDDVNAALQLIERLNGDISASRIGSRDTAAYEQARDDQIDIVAENLPIRLMSRANGQVAVLTDTGVTLLDVTARTLEFTRTNVVTADMDYRAGGSPLSGLSVEGQQLEPGSGRQAVSSGRIAGLFEVRDSTLVDATAEVDALAADLTARFEGAGIVGADGRGLFTDGGAALSPSPVAGLAGRLAVNERVDPAQGGDVWRIRDGLDATAPGPAAASAHAQRMLDAMTETRLATGSLSRPASAAGAASDLGTLFERQGQGIEDNAALALSRLTTLENAESQSIGVDLDQEMQSLLLIEQAYGANAKVIEVADRLIQRLLEI